MPKLSNPQKAEAISGFSALGFDPAGRPIVCLLDILIEETRISNDTADSETVAKNQGKLEAYKDLRCYLIK